MTVIEKTCPCGKNIEYVTESYGCVNFGEFVSKTGWKIVLCHDGNTIYMCPECYEKARVLAYKILEIVGTEYLYFPSLIKMKKGE